MLDKNTMSLSLKVVVIVCMVTMSSICLDFFFTPVEAYSAGKLVKLFTWGHIIGLYTGAGGHAGLHVGSRACH